MTIQLHFDRGTLTINCGRKPPPPVLQDFVTWDQRVEVWRSPAHNYRTIKTTCELHGIALDGDIFPNETLSGDWHLPELRPYQQAAITAWRVAGSHGIACLPTGAGKTLLAAAAIEALRVPTLCLVPTRALLEQWVQTLGTTYSERIGRLGDGDRDIRPLTIATFESAYRSAWWLGQRFPFVIVDEVHHFGAGLRDEALQMSAAPYRLGLTATPPDSEAQLANLRALVGGIVYEQKITDLVGKFLSDFHLLCLHLPLTTEERRYYQADFEVFRQFWDAYRVHVQGADWQAFRRLAMKSPEGRKALTAYRRAKSLLSYTTGKRQVLAELLARHMGQKILIFTADVETALTAAREFLIMPIVADVPRRERESVLQAFRVGTLKTLISCKVLNEGVDVPDAEVAIVLGGSSNSREHIQRIGRLLRPAEGKRALIYELVAADTMEVKHSIRRGKSFVTHKTIKHRYDASPRSAELPH